MRLESSLALISIKNSLVASSESFDPNKGKRNSILESAILGLIESKKSFTSICQDFGFDTIPNFDKFSSKTPIILLPNFFLTEQLTLLPKRLMRTGRVYNP